MIIMINGPFGAGKSTVAKRLRSALPGSKIYDPEWAGSVLMRASKLIRLKGLGTDDFQDIKLWRRLTIGGIGLFARFASGPVIVPMTFSRWDYLKEVITGIPRPVGEIGLFCLKAAPATLTVRLTNRGLDPGSAEAEWVSRRNIECAIAQSDPAFGEPIETDNRTAEEVTAYIIERLGIGN
jgi:hypothetical protein